MTLHFSKRIILALSLIPLIGVLASCGGHRGMGHHDGRVFDYVAYKLDFNEEQEALLDQLRVQTELVRDEFKDQRQAQRRKLADLIAAETLDVDAIKALMEEHQQQFNVITPRLTPSVVALHASLNEKQKEKIAKYMEKWLRHTSH